MNFNLQRLMLLLALFAMSATTSPAVAAEHARTEHAQLTLIADSLTPRAGSTLDLGLQIELDRGWHIYWLNPGETGYPPRLNWEHPSGIEIDAPRFPPPVERTLAGMRSNVIEGAPVLLSRMHLSPKLAPGAALPITLAVDLLACSESQCVPGSATLSLNLAVGDGSAGKGKSRLDQARSALPAGPPVRMTYTVDDRRLTLRFADADGGAFDHLFFQAPALNPIDRVSDQAASGLSYPLGDDEAAPFVQLRGVLTQRHPDGSLSATTFVAERADSDPQVARAAPSWDMTSFVIALLGALAGGLLLNLMPCVFPILSLKAMALMRSGGDRMEARHEALGYAAGAVSTIVALGIILLTARAMGTQLGWAFQLQNAHVVALLLLLVVVIALNLTGLFELPQPNLNLGASGGFMGGLSTGALAAFIATPCTGPFMAGALGAALMMPVPAALAVFVGLGVGLSLPFVAIGFIDPVRQHMPRPGPWMVTLRHLLSLPMFATALWLIWVLGQEAGISAMTLSLGLCIILSLALWWYGRLQATGKRAWVPVAVAAATVVMTFYAPASAARHAIDAPLGGQQAYSAKALQSLRAGHQPTFLYLTADWCLTCKVNEATTLKNQAVLAAFKSHHVTVMVGDWTHGEPAVTQLLVKYRRAGVPLYIYFPASGQPVILPQVLTPALVLSRIGMRAVPHSDWCHLL